MIIFLIGHRGSGKTSLLKRIQQFHFPGDRAVDLDEEIERASGLSIAEIFRASGEAEFRRWEDRTLQNLLASVGAGVAMSTSSIAGSGSDGLRVHRGNHGDNYGGNHAEREFFWICIGAGCRLDFPLPPESSFLWVKRQTDALGRIFLDRPLLDPSPSALSMSPPLADFLKRFPERERNFARAASCIYEIPEGLGILPTSEKEQELEKSLLQGLRSHDSPPRPGLNFQFESRRTDRGQLSPPPKNDFENPIITIPGSDQDPTGNLRFVWPESLAGPYLEFRDDRILPPTNALLPAGTLLSSRIKSGGQPLTEQFPFSESTEWDWGLELGAPPVSVPPTSARKPDVLSLHERKATIEETLSDFDHRCAGVGAHQKLAIEIANFSELEKVWRWQQEKPRLRSVLPRTPGAQSPSDGRWTWFRLFMKGRQKINFISSGVASAPDQPSIWQWLTTPAAPKKFASVLGFPAFHSFSPEMHREFFALKQMPFWAIPVPADEFSGALPFLQELGLVAAAVTSPLKDLVGGNTWWRSSDGVTHVDNTDVVGLQSELGQWISTPGISNAGASSDPGAGPIAVYGGGGTLASLVPLFPEAHYYSQRTGELRDPLAGPDKSTNRESRKPARTPRKSYELGIWAAAPHAEIPKWNANVIYDLNYRADSRAREWALRTGARYISGLGLFVKQALAQQNLWRSL